MWPMQRVEIRVKGQTDRHWSDWFEGLAITHTDQGETILTGFIADQAALHGLLAKVRDLGVSLLSVNSKEVDDWGGSLLPRIAGANQRRQLAGLDLEGYVAQRPLTLSALRCRCPGRGAVATRCRLRTGLTLRTTQMAWRWRREAMPNGQMEPEGQAGHTTG